MNKNSNFDKENQSKFQLFLKKVKENPIFTTLVILGGIVSCFIEWYDIVSNINSSFYINFMRENYFYIMCVILMSVCSFKEILLILHNREFSDFNIEFAKLCIAFKNENNVMRALPDIYDSLIREIVPFEDQKYLDVKIKCYTDQERKDHCLRNLEFLAKKYKCLDLISN